jgi:hypothetical protein
MRYSKEEKAKQLEAWKKSGKSAWSYAKANSLNPQTFVNWSKAEQTNFVEVPVRMPTMQDHAHHLRIEKGDVKIYIPLNMESVKLRAVMEGIGAAIW